MAVSGKVYLVGAGPGDPGLITLKGWRCLQQADLVLYDGLVSPLLLQHTRASAERTCRVGPPGERRLNQDEINAQLIAAARQGKTVVRLKGGDPFIFGRGSEEAAALTAAGIEYEVVPGITAATGAGACAGISLTHRELASAVALITGHEDPRKPASVLDYEALARFPGTLVFYMGLHQLPRIVEELQAHGKPGATLAAVISHGGSPRQRIVSGTLATIAAQVIEAGLRPPSLIIIGECVSLAPMLNWVERRPLHGLRIGITRPEGQFLAAAELALQLGAEPAPLPTLRIRPVEDVALLDGVLDRLAEFDWVIFTSVNAVEAVLKRIWQRGEDARKFAGLKLAAIGPATAEALQRHALRADLTPAEYRGEALAAALEPLTRRRRVLWPRANRGRDILPDQLTAAGAAFEQVVVYLHEDLPAPPTATEALWRKGELDWIALSSPAIARQIAHWMEEHRLPHSPRFAAISPVTAAAAQHAGLDVAAVAEEHTWSGLLQAIADVVRLGSTRSPG